jgi:hypothetical protein
MYAVMYFKSAVNITSVLYVKTLMICFENVSHVISGLAVNKITMEQNALC